MGGRPNRYRSVRGREYASLQSNQQRLIEQLAWKSEGLELKRAATIKLSIDIFAPEYDVLMRLKKRGLSVPTEATLDLNSLITVSYCFEYCGPDSAQAALRDCIERVWTAGGEARTVELDVYE